MRQMFEQVCKIVTAPTVRATRLTVGVVTRAGLRVESQTAAPLPNRSAAHLLEIAPALSPLRFQPARFWLLISWFAAGSAFLVH